MCKSPEGISSTLCNKKSIIECFLDYSYDQFITLIFEFDLCYNMNMNGPPQKGGFHLNHPVVASPPIENCEGHPDLNLSPNYLTHFLKKLRNHCLLVELSSCISSSTSSGTFSFTPNRKSSDSSSGAFPNVIPCAAGPACIFRMRQIL